MLDPKSDIVFKLLLARADNVGLLRSMVEAVLDLPAPLTEVVVLNPEVSREHASHKPIVLDLHVRCGDGTLLDIEMETYPRPVLADRVTYYATSLHSSQLVRGEDYRLLCPAVSIVWLNGTLKPLGDQFHSTFSLREDHTYAQLTSQVRLHFLALSQFLVDPRPVSPRLSRWARFFLASDAQALHALAVEDGTMKQAVSALERLSRDPEAVALVDTIERDRRFARHERALELAEAQRVGREEGREEGRKEGREELARQLLAEGEPLERVARLTQLSMDQLADLAAR